MTTGSTRLLIVGAGPTGLTLACRCRQLGLDVRLIDRKSGPATTSNAIGLQYRVSEILAMLGVADRFVQEASSPTAVNLYVGERRLLRFRFLPNARVAGKEAFQPRALMIPQSRTEIILGEFFQELGGSIEWDTELIQHSQSRDGVIAILRRPDGSGEQWSGRWLVSCEGAHSRVRGQAGLKFQGETYPLYFLLADVETERGPEGNENHVWLHPDGSVALLPLPGKKVWRCFVEATAQPPEPDLPVHEIWSLIQSALVTRVPSAENYLIKQANWVSQFGIHCRLVDHYRVGGVFLAGDAAHIHSYTGGQGITTGMQDAFNLAWKLSRVAQGAPPSLLDTYEEERRPQAEAVLQQTDKVTKLFVAASPGKRWLREFLILPMLRTEWLQEKFFGRFSQLQLSYATSSLAMDQAIPWWHRWVRPRAGDRAPDIVLRSGDTGATLTLLELLRQGRPIVLLGEHACSSLGVKPRPLLDALVRLQMEPYSLVSSSGQELNEPARTLIDVHGDWFRLYGLKEDFVCLIRPDGHLGLVQRPASLIGLEEYLGLICSSDAVNAEFENL